MTQTELAPRPAVAPAVDGLPEISVVIPVYNEAGTLEEVVPADRRRPSSPSAGPTS